MAKLRRAKLMVNNGSVVVYYSHEGIMRFPTGVVIDKKQSGKGKKSKYVEWDYKDNLIKTNVPNYETKRATMERLLNIANKILSEHFDQGEDLKAKDLERLLSTESVENVKKRTTSVFELYEDFYERKRRSFAARDSLISLKDYTSFRNMLIDYEAIHQTKLKVKDIDKRFLGNLLAWLRGPMPEKVGDHKIRIKGKMNDHTCGKRFDILLHFWKDLHEEGKVADTRFIQKFIADEIHPVSGDKVTLTIEEVHSLYEYPFEQINHQNIRDLFVFACLTGLRWSDLEQFDPAFIRLSADNTGSIYRRTAGKTRASSAKRYEIPLCEIVMEILERHDGSLRPIMVSNVEANRRIKEALQITGMFNAVTEIIDKDTDQYIRRWEAVTMHKGRDTFISNLVNTTPLNELMKYTAHTKLSTLQGYIDKNRAVSMQYINQAFNRKNHERR